MNVGIELLVALESTNESWWSVEIDTCEQDAAVRNPTCNADDLMAKIHSNESYKFVNT